MKLKTLITIAVAVSLTVLLGACDRSGPPAVDEKTQLELKETKATLAKVQASLEKMEVDINDMQNQKSALEDELEKIKIKLKSTLQAYDQLQQQTGVLAKELETTKSEMAEVTRKRDELQQQVQLLAKEKNDVIAMVVSATPSDMPKIQEEIKKNPAAKPLQNAALAVKLQEAESYLNAGNWQAAERLLFEIRAVDADYPGLEALNSRIQNLKAQLNNQMQTPKQ